MLVDISKKQAQITISMTRSDEHVGACCYPASGQSKVAIKVNYAAAGIDIVLQ